MALFTGDPLTEVVRLALAQDVAAETTAAVLIPAELQGAAVAVAKGSLVLAGLDAAEQVFAILDPAVKFTRKASDGAALAPGDVAFEVAGPMRTLLTGEHTALSFVRQLSGVATFTQAAVHALAGTKTKLVDTRKPTPGLQTMQKRAVRAAGVQANDSRLADGILIRDSHVAAMESITQAVRRAREQAAPRIRIEVEVRTLLDVREALAAGADMLLLDNMTDAQLAAAVELVGGRIPTEASGNITLERLPAVAKLGVDFVSMGSLTQSAPVADLSFAITRL